MHINEKKRNVNNEADSMHSVIILLKDYKLTSQLYSNHVRRANTPNCTDIKPNPTHESMFAFLPAFRSNS